jgi:hypothetical protein
MTMKIIVVCKLTDAREYFIRLKQKTKKVILDAIAHFEYDLLIRYDINWKRSQSNY